MNLLNPLRRPSTGFIISESFDCCDAFGHGGFQRRMFPFVIFALVALNCHAFVLPAIARGIEHWCKQPSDSNISLADWRDQFVPVEADGRLSSCYVYKHPNDTDETGVTPCQQWEYGNGSDRTVVSLWNLVCHRHVLFVAALVVQNTGSIVIPAVAGPYADYIGRVPVIIAAACVLLASTIGSCLVTSYVIYTIFRFLCNGSVVVYTLVNAVSVFEITTHGRRPLDIVFGGTLGYVLFNAWAIFTSLVEPHWSVKQAIFLAPTLVALGAFFVVKESPRWLVAKGDLDAAEYVMLEGARLNRFPLPSTASLMVKLREHVNRRSNECIGDDHEAVLDGCSLQRRIVIMMVSYFALTFAFYVVEYSVPRHKVTLQYVSFIVLLLAYALMHVLITRVPLVRVHRFCFLVLGGIQCLMSATAGIQATVVAEGLASLSRAFASVAVVVNLAYTLELFPTAVRTSALCWTIASGRFGAVCASVVIPLQKRGREDVAFFVAGCALFWSLIALRYLPRATGVECAKTEARHASTQRESLINLMKKTLEPHDDRRASTSSSGNSRSSSRIMKTGSRAGSRRSLSRRSLSAGGLHASSY